MTPRPKRYYALTVIALLVGMMRNSRCQRPPPTAGAGNLAGRNERDHQAQALVRDRSSLRAATTSIAMPPINGKIFINTNIPVMQDTIALVLALAQKYRYSYYDSLILAAALSAGYEMLATEDMQHGQIIEDVLKIYYPFAKQ